MANSILNQYNAYQENVAKRKKQEPARWYSGEQPTNGEILARITSIFEQDEKAGNDFMNQYRQIQADPSSPYFNPYNQATNPAVSNLAGLGFDVSLLNDRWLSQNEGWINANLEYRGNTTTPSAPTKKSTPEQATAYYLWRYRKNEGQTQKAELELQAAMQEVQQLVNDPYQNLSDEEVVAKVKKDFAKKYPTLAKMDTTDKAAPVEFNRPIAYSDDALRGAAWAARNPDYNGDMEMAAAYSILGRGNTWQKNEELAQKRANNPYSAGPVGAEDACTYYGIYSIPRGWSNEHAEDAYSDDETRVSAYKHAREAEMNANAAEDALEALNWKLGDRLKNVTDPAEVQKALDSVLAQDSIRYNGQDVDIKILKKMDDSLGKGEASPTGSWIAMGRPVDYKYSDMLAKWQENVTSNGHKFNAYQLVNSTIAGPKKRQTQAEGTNAINAGAGSVYNNYMGLSAENAIEGYDANQAIPRKGDRGNQYPGGQGEAAAEQAKPEQGTNAFAGSDQHAVANQGKPGQVNTLTGSEPGAVTDQGKTGNGTNAMAGGPAAVAKQGKAGQGNQLQGSGAVSEKLKASQNAQDVVEPVAVPEPEVQAEQQQELANYISDADIEVAKQKDKKIYAAQGAMEDQMTDDEKTVFSNAGSSMIDRAFTFFRQALSVKYVMDNMRDMSADESAKKHYDTVLDTLFEVDQYETQKANLEYLLPMLEDMKAKYGDPEDALKTFPKSQTIESNGVQINLEYDEETGKYWIYDLIDTKNGVSYNPALDGEPEDPELKEAVRIAKAATFSVNMDVKRVHDIQSAYSEEELTEYAQLYTDVQNAQTALDAEKQQYDAKLAAYEQSEKDINMLINAIEVLGGDTSGIRMAQEVSNFLTDYQEQPAIYQPEETLLTTIDRNLTESGAELTAENRNKALDTALDTVENTLASLDYVEEWCNENGYLIPENIQNNIRFTRQDMEARRKYIEYAKIEANADPEEYRKAVEAGKKFEEEQDRFVLDSIRPVAYDLRNNEDATEEEKDLFYYLLGRSVMELGETYENQLKSSDPDESQYGAINTLSKIYQEGREYLDLMFDSDQGIISRRSVENSKESEGTVLQNIAATLLSPQQSVDSLLYIIDLAVTGDRLNPNSAFRRIGAFKEGTRAATKKNIDEYFSDKPVMKWLANAGYEIYCNRGDSMVNAMVFGAVNPFGDGIIGNIVGALPMGFYAAVDAGAHAVERGANMEQTWLIMGATAFAETVSEGVTYSNIRSAMGTAKEFSRESLKDFVKDWLFHSGLEEAVGETWNNDVERLADNLAAKWFEDKDFISEHEALVREYESKGMLHKDAEAAAWTDELKEDGYTALISYLSEGADVVLATGRSVVNSANALRGYTRSRQKIGYGESMLQNAVNLRRGKVQPTQTAQQQTTTEQKTAPAETAQAETEQTVTTPTAEEQSFAQRQGQDTYNVLNPQKPSAQQETTAGENAATDEATQRNNTYANAFFVIERAKGSDQSTMTAAIGTVLAGEESDPANQQRTNDRANAAAAFAPTVLGENAGTVIQEVMQGADEFGLQPNTIKRALCYAILGDGKCTEVITSEAFQNATPKEKAMMLNDALTEDIVNGGDVASNILAKTNEYREGRVISDLAAEGHFDQAIADRAEADQKTREAEQANKDLSKKRAEREAAEENVKRSADEVTQNPNKDTVSAHSSAIGELAAAQESEHQYEQHQQKAEAQKIAAEEKAEKSAGDAMTEAREIAKQKVEEEDNALAQAEQQQAAEEQAQAEAQAQAQAEEDQRTGKTQQDQDYEQIDALVDSMNLDEEESEDLKQQLRDRRDQSEEESFDPNAKLTDAQSFLALGALQRKLGIPIVFSDNLGNADGKYADGIIYLNAKKAKDGSMRLGRALLETALHEFTHSIQGTKSYEAYDKAVIGILFGEGENFNQAAYEAEIQDRMVRYRDAVGKELTPEEARREIVADFAKEHLTDSDVVARMMDAGLGGKIRNALHNINQAIKNFFKMLKGEDMEMAEKFRKAERLYQKALNERARIAVHPNGDQFSIPQFVQAAGLQFHEGSEEHEMGVYQYVYGADGKKMKDTEGNYLLGEKVEEVTPEMMEQTPVGMLVRKGIPDKKTQKAALKMFSDLMSMVLKYQDSNLVWEIAGSTLESTFSALKSNSDPQYQTTIDFGTVCAKTQAILDVMSEVMLNRVKEGKTGGLTRQEIMKIYDATHNAGLSVPCPVCYVFSRWMGVPSMLGQMSKFQHDYVVTNDDGTINMEETKKRANEYIRKAHEKYGDKKGVADAKTSIMNRLKSRETSRKTLTQEISDLTKVIENKSTEEKTRKKVEAQREAAQKKLDTVLEEMTDLETDLGAVEAYNWITQALCLQERKGNSVTNVTDENGDYVIDPEFVVTPDEVLFDLRRTGDFAKYKKNWKYRTTRGAGMGKAILPYSGAAIGDILYGSATRRLTGNAWVDMDSKSATLRWAKDRAKKQNLVGGQRLQSTSDFRPEWGLDYIMAFLELQAAQSNAQMYTKVAEAVDLFASVGADVNLSIMGYGDGFHEATAEEIALAESDTDEGKELRSRMGTVIGEDGKAHTYILDFSDVTGMEYGTARQKTKDWDNVQMILVGMNDTHIRLAMANNDIDFIIPWHSSGNSRSVLAQLVASVREKLSTSSDYTDSQTDQFLSHDEIVDGKKVTIDDRAPEQKMLWEARLKILKGNANKTSEKGGLTKEEREAVMRNPYLRDLYDRFYNKQRGDKCYHVKLDDKQAKQIFPYEYWDTTSTKETADVNGQRFVKYCEALGLKPRFSQFKDEKGYWKLLIDRRMYDRKGNYREQQQIDVTKAKVGALNENGELTGSQLPMKTSAKYGSDYQEQMDRAVETAQSMLEDPFGPGLIDDSDTDYTEESESDEEYSVSGRRRMTDAELDDLLRQAGVRTRTAQPVRNINEIVSNLGWTTSETDEGETQVFDGDGNLVGTINGNQIDIDPKNPNIDAYKQALNRVMFAPGMTEATLEGENPSASTSLGPAVRAFAADNGMLQKSDELDRFAKAIVNAQRTYFPETNAQQIARAINWIRSLKQSPNSDGYAEALDEVMNDRFDYRSADGQARMVAVMGMAVAKNDVLAQAALSDAYMRQGTDIGRALQARKMFLLMTPDGRKQSLRNMLKNMQDNLYAKGKQIDLHLSDWVYKAAAVAESEEDFNRVRRAAAAELSEQLPVTWGERIIAWRMLSMLSAPKTHIRNTIGNLMNVPVVGVKNKVGAAIEILSQKLGLIDKNERTKTLGLANPEARTYARTRSKAVEDELRGTEKYKSDLAIQERKVFGTKNGIVSKTFGKLLQGWYDLNGKALEAEDWIFLKGHYQRALSGYMTARGLTPADMKGKVLEEADAYAIQEAHKATYRDESGVANWLNRIGSKRTNSENNKALSVIQWVVNTRFPFKRTPINIAKRGIEYSAVGLGKSLFYDSVHLKQYLDYQNGKLKALPTTAISPSEWIDKFSAGLTGSAIMVAGALARAFGVARAGFKKDDPDDELAKMAGDKEYSIKFEKLINTIGQFFDPNFEFELLGEDVATTMDWAVPTALPFFTGTALFDYFTEGKGFSVGAVLDLLMEITDPMMNMSFMSGVKEMFRNNNYSSKDSFWQFMEKTGINFVTSLIPTWSGQLANTIDGSRTTYKGSESLTGDEDIDKMIQQIGNKLPWINLGGIPYTNTLGEESEHVIASWAENLLSPAYFSRVDESKEWTELRRLVNADPDYNRRIIPSEPDHSIKVNGKNIPLTGEEFTKLKADHGSVWRKAVQDIIDNPLYAYADDESRAEMFNVADTYAMQIAKWKTNSGYKVDSWVMNAYKNGNAADAIIDKVASTNKSNYVKAQADSFAKALYSSDKAQIKQFAEELQQAHASTSDVRKQLTAYFKPLYIEAWKNNDNTTVSLIEDILTSINDYVELDKPITTYTTRRDFEKWIASPNSVSEEEEDEDPNNWLNMNP